jgi:GNAT superfamily N-acetyltransferase
MDLRRALISPSSTIMPLVLRAAMAPDVPVIRELIEGLADYEQLRNECIATDALLQQALFGERPYAEVVLAELDGQVAGFALFFHNFSTFLARPGIYLEDLFVRPAFRGHGVGKALLSHLAQLAVQRGCGRLEWSVLDWNVDAIGFYEKLGARAQDAWTVYRVTGDALTQLASGDA